jgi:hypothetical protein
VIRIRYCDLPAGLHIRIEEQGSRTTVWLLPGLTPAQRQAALRRAKGAARVGQGPDLPPAELTRALAADWLRAIVRNGLRAMRLHPAIFFPPLVILMSAAVAYLLLVSVSIQFLPGMHPHEAGQIPRHPVPHQILPPPGPVQGSAPASQPPASGPASPQPGPSSPDPTRSGKPSPSPDPSPTATEPGSPSPTPSPTAPSPSPSAPSSAPPSPLPTKQPTPAPSPSTGGACLHLGPVGLCLGL